MSEFAPTPNKAQELSDRFDANKKAAEEKQYWESMNGEAGTTDFSEEARTRLAEASEYDAHLAKMAARDENYDALEAMGTQSPAFDQEHADAIAMNEEFDANAQAEKEAREAFEAKIQDTIVGNAKLRYARRLAKDVADARAYQPNENDNVDQLAEDIAAKEDHIEALVSSFLESDAAESLSADEKNAVLDAIYNTTDSSETEATSLDDESDDETTETSPADEETTPTTPESDDDLEEETDDKEATSPADTEETTPTAPETDNEDDLEEETDDDEDLGEETDNEEDLEEETDDDEEDLGEETDDETTETSPADTDTDHERETGPKAFFLRAYYRSKNAIGDFLKSKLGSDNEKAKRNRWIALGSVAAVAAAGAAAWYFTSRYTGGTPSMPSNPNTPSAGDLPDVTPTAPSNPNTGGLETTVDTGSTGGSEVYNFSDAARTVTPGEGWYETMEQMNIPAGERVALLQKVGSQLEQIGAAYPDEALGGWGMNTPANGQLSDQALQIIANARR